MMKSAVTVLSLCLAQAAAAAPFGSGAETEIFYDGSQAEVLYMRLAQAHPEAVVMCGALPIKIVKMGAVACEFDGYSRVGHQYQCGSLIDEDGNVRAAQAFGCPNPRGGVGK